MKINSLLILAWMGHASLGMIYGFLGPARPYLARQVGVGHQSISYLWSAKSLGVTLACFWTKIRPNFKENLIFLSLSLGLASICFILMAFTTNFPSLVTIYLILTFGSGSFDILDNSFMSLIGSNSIIQSLHASTAFGFVVTSLSFAYFHQKTEVGCFKSLGDENLNEEETILRLPMLIISTWTFLTSFGLLILSLISKNEKEFSQKSTSQSSKSILPILMSIFIFFITSIDGTFQSKLYILGLCGPWKLSHYDSAILNSVYFLFYLFGRLISVPISRAFSPQIMIKSALIGAFFASLVFLNNFNLVLASALMGFSLSFFFASSLNWLKSKVENPPVFYIFMGSNLANFLMPPLASKLFENDPFSVLYLTLSQVILASLCFLFMEKMCQKIE